MIFFDIDGTLLDHKRAEELGAIEFLKKYSEALTFSESEFLIIWKDLSDTYFEKFLLNEISFQEQRRMRIKELFGPISDAEADLKFTDYLNFYQDNWLVFDDVLPCLEQFKQREIRLGIISNGDFNQQMEKLKRINVRHYFECVLTSSKIGVSKPEATIFKKASIHTNVPINDCYYIGDQLETDALGSENAGLKGIWLNRVDKASHPDVTVIHSLSELQGIIE